MNIKKFVLPVVAITGLTVGVIQMAQADPFTAGVNITEVLAIAETTGVDFGNMSVAEGTCIMATGGGLTNAGGADCTGTATPGDFAITGSEVSATLTLVGGATVSGLQFEPLFGTNDTQSLSGLPSTLGAVEVIGTLTISTGVATGVSQTAAYTLSAAYD
ncbi:MAG: hypothetical protein JKY24_05280 [Pseudomonadales bacterium]|nr:hypothetical protein [Pseudomonadales bacterium]